MKDTLIIYREWWGAIKSLPPAHQLQAYDAICAYAFEGTLPEDPIVSAMTALMRSTIDRDKAKWESVREKRVAAGRKGGAPKGNKNAQKQANQAKQSNACSAQNKKQLKQANQAKQSNQANACTTEEVETEQLADVEKTTKTSKQAKQAVNVLCNSNNINIQDINIKNNSENQSSESLFEEFRKAYPGRKRGHDTELEAFKRKHKNWVEIVPRLMPALQRLLQHNEEAKNAGQFVPSFANLSTWLYQARWEEELPEVRKPQAVEVKMTATAADYDDDEDIFQSKNR